MSFWVVLEIKAKMEKREAIFAFSIFGGRPLSKAKNGEASILGDDSPDLVECCSAKLETTTAER